MSIYILGFRKAGGQITRKQYYTYYFGDIRGQPRGASKKLKGKLHLCLSKFHKNILILDNLDAQVINCKVRYIHVYLTFTKYSIFLPFLLAYSLLTSYTLLQKHDVRIIIGGFAPDIVPNVFCEVSQH